MGLMTDYRMTDETLIQRIQNGQLDSAGLLYQRYKKVLWAYFYNSTGKRETSEDLVQLTFEKMIRYRSKYSGKGSVKSWLFSIARNALKDEWKAQGKHTGIPIAEAEYLMPAQVPPVDSQVIYLEKEALFKQAMGHLSREKRELLAQAKLQDKKYKELAGIYGMSESALKVKVFRIMQELKAYVDKVQENAGY